MKFKDVIEEAVPFKLNGRDWWHQKINGWDGNLISARLYDGDGYFVSEFESMEELVNFVKGVKEVC